jgi:3-deoxy-D-manno-octulosonic-acid transferase
LIIFTIFRSLRLHWPLALPARFGFIPATELAKLANRRVILLHAVSVGEVIAARPLIAALRARYPGHALVVSSGTDTGRQMAAALAEVDLCIYFPFDFLPSIHYILNLLKPSIVIIMETEIWPNFSRETSRRGIPLVMANGRISERSLPRYLKFSWFFREALQNFSLLCMQSEVAMERIIAIGAAAERVVVCGNLKYDIPFHKVSSAEKSAFRKSCNIPDDCLVITAGSTHGGEEEILLKVYLEMQADSTNLFLVLAPRHPQRTAEVADILQKYAVPFCRFTELQPDSSAKFKTGEVLLVDTVGELMNLYGLADVVFVGGSLVPTGGHNLLEPASLGIPTLFGTFMSNFKEITALVLESRAGIQVETTAELVAVLRRLIADPEERRDLGENGLNMIKVNGGATVRYIEAIANQLLNR